MQLTLNGNSPFYHGTFECKILRYRISSLYNLKETLILTSWTLLKAFIRSKEMCRLKSDSLHIGVQIKFCDKFSYAASEVTRSFFAYVALLRVILPSKSY